MSDEREQALLDRIDRELRETLDVAPSPELLPRVRAAVEASASRRWSWSWLLPVAAGGAALVAAVWLLGRPPAPQPAVETARSAPPSTLAEPKAVAGPERVESPRSSVPRAAVRRAPLEPEVLVPPGQEEALLRLAAALRTGKVDAAGLLPAEAPAPKDLAIAPLEELPPLELRPLVSGTDSEGVDQ